MIQRKRKNKIIIINVDNKQLRELIGLNQTQVANELGVVQSTVAMWENGKNKPRTERLIQLARLYGCTVDELLAEEDGGKSA